MTASRQTRADYDQIAERYDDQPIRHKNADPLFLTFLRERPAPDPSSLTILDVCCGTGSQLVANQPFVPSARVIGLDLSRGMLKRACRKAPDLFWVQADSSQLPFPGGRFDFISNQFALHHIRDKEAMLADVFRLLRAGGRFALTNIAPQEMSGWHYYRYFPAAYRIDLQAFLAPDDLVALLDHIGFVRITCERERMTSQQDLSTFLEEARRRDRCSQLLTISDEEYETGLQQIASDLQQGRQTVPSEHCLLTLCADKPDSSIHPGSNA